MYINKKIKMKINKCSERSMKVKLPTLLKYHDRQTNRIPNQRTNQLTNGQTDRQGHRGV